MTHDPVVDEERNVVRLETLDGQVVRLRLANLTEHRRAIAKIMRMYAGGKISENKARCLGYLSDKLLSVAKVEQDTELLRRVEALENRLDRGNA